VENLSRIIQRSVLKIDQNVEFSTVNFARINYRLTWTGLPRDMNKITLANNAIKRAVGKYFSNWSYTIKISKKESEAGI